MEPPAWAKGHRIHFEPPTIAASAYSAEELGLEGEGEGGPVLYWEAGQGVQRTPKLYLVFWGSNFTTTEKGKEARSMLSKLAGGLSGTGYQGILTQYFDSIGRVSSTVSSASYVDSSVAAPTSVNGLKVEEEVQRAINANGWKPELSAQFIVVTAPGSTYEKSFVINPNTGKAAFCAFHGVTASTANVSGGTIYGFVPYQGDSPFNEGCITVGNPSGNPVYKTSKSTSHEYAEAATDPKLGEWLDASFEAELSDLCSFHDDFELASGAYAQSQYDDHLNGCAASDPEPPHSYAVTVAPTVKSTEVTLKGTVNPEGLASSYYFEYGPTKAYGSKTAEVNAGPGVANVSAAQTIVGLTQNTSYHYRLVEANSSGTTASNDAVLTTLAVPPAAETTAASNVTATEATLRGSVNPLGSATKFQFQYGPTTGYGYLAPLLPENTGSGFSEIQKGFAIPRLLPSTTYHFRIKATNSQGTTYGKDMSFTTAPLTPTFSSNFGSLGSGNGQLNQPTGIAVNPRNGNLVVPDEGNNRVEVFNEAGVCLSQFGSFGTGNGQFNQPRGAAVDSMGNIWVVDTGNNRVEKFNEKGEYLSKFGSAGSGNGQFASPKNLDVDSKGNVWVADSGNNRVEKFNEKGEYLSQFSAGTNPIGLAIDAKGNVWSGNENESGAIEEHNENGNLIRSFATRGVGNGQVREPRRLFVDSDGYVWVPDALNNRVEVFSEKGEYVTKFGSFGSGTEQMSYPVGVAIDPRGNVWVDDNNDRIDHWKLTSTWPATFSSNFGTSGSGSGQFNQPTGIAINPFNGNLVVPDEGNNRVEVFNEGGEYLSRFGGYGTGNGQFNQPRGAAVDAKGSIWIVDTGNNRVEHFGEQGEYLSQFGSKGSGNGQLLEPKNLSVDSQGNVWVADSGNNRVQKFNEKGESLSQFSTGSNPIGIAFDSSGNVWTTTDAATGVIEEHNSKGEFLQSFASRGEGVGQLLEPKRLAVDENGFIWVPDAANDRVEVFNARGEYVTKFGTWAPGPEQMNYPTGVAVDPRGDVWIDDNNNRIDRWVR